MPVKRRVSKVLAHRITPEAIDAYQRGDYAALHVALNLKPWECSPLPIEYCALGVDQDPAPEWMRDVQSWQKAQELQRALDAATGKGTARSCQWPGPAG